MQHGEAYLDARTYEKVKNSEAGIYAELGIRVAFTNAFRTPADTAALQELGLHPSTVSAHLCGCAIDINWNAIPRSAQSAVVGIFHANGLMWGGSFHNQPIDERHHFYDLNTLRSAPIKELIHDAQERYEELSGGGP